jgi:AraC-like DNA-binding protein
MASNAQRFDSRQSMQNKTFEVFHYRDQKMEGLEVHHHDFYEVYLFLGGQVQFQVEAKTFQLEPGDFLLINPQELHKPLIGQGSMYERMVLWIDRNYLSSLCTENTDLSACFDGQTNLLRPGKVRSAQLQGLLESLAREYYDEQLGSAICAQGLLMQFLVELNRLARKNMGKALAEPDLVSQVIAYIGNHYQENLTLESLAGQFYVSKFYLSHEFRERVGVSIHRYIIFRRLLQARDLMAAGIGPGQVYQNCGFGDYANFYRAFKAEYGISPREFVQGK